MRLKSEEFLRRLDRIGETRAGFARRCKISRQSITAWIDGERNPKMSNVKVMADALRCRIGDIAEPTTGIETAAMHGDQFAQSVLGVNTGSAADNGAESFGKSAELDREMLDFVKKQFAEQAQSSTQAALGKRLGLSATTINRLIHGNAELGSLPISILGKLCPDLINREVLNPSPDNSLVPASDVRPVATGDGAFVPIISSAAAASCNPGLMPLLDCVNQYSEDNVFFKQAKPGDFAIEVSGTSMSPWYPEGTLLLVRPYQDLRNGQRVVVVLDEGEIIFKIYAERGDKICLFSIDGEGRDYVFTKPRVPIRYICRVVASIRNEDDLDEEMAHRHIAHDWQRKLNDVSGESK